MDRASKGLMDFMDKHEGRAEGSSYKAINKERVRQGYKAQGEPPAHKALEAKKGDSIYKDRLKRVYAGAKKYGESGNPKDRSFKQYAKNSKKLLGLQHMAGKISRSAAESEMKEYK